MNLRELVGIEDEPYFKFNREERHTAAIVFHLLSYAKDGDNYPRNAELVLQFAGCDWEVNAAEFGIYFEYSYPRDLWNKIGFKARFNERKRLIITQLLAKNGFDTSRLGLLTSAEEFNAYFIGTRPSAEYRLIQSPANWSLAQLAGSLPSKTDDNDLLTACMLKWAFRAKPDIVIHADRQHALCIELKIESKGGSYPSNSTEKLLLKKRGLFGGRKAFPLPMSQVDLQKFLMTNLLGFDCEYLLIAHGESGAGRKSWSDFLDLPLDKPRHLPPYIEVALKNLKLPPVSLTRRGESSSPAPPADRIPHP